MKYRRGRMGAPAAGLTARPIGCRQSRDQPIPCYCDALVSSLGGVLLDREGQICLQKPKEHAYEMTIMAIPYALAQNPVLSPMAATPSAVSGREIRCAMPGNTRTTTSNFWRKSVLIAMSPWRHPTPGIINRGLRRQPRRSRTSPAATGLPMWPSVRDPVCSVDRRSSADADGDFQVHRLAGPRLLLPFAASKHDPPQPTQLNVPVAIGEGRRTAAGVSVAHSDAVPSSGERD